MFGFGVVLQSCPAGQSEFWSQAHVLFAGSQKPLAHWAEPEHVWPISLRHVLLQPSPLVVLPSSQPSPA
jgi:hypothetical protein